MAKGPSLAGSKEGNQSLDIALVISDLGSGGAQRVVTTLANEWTRSGYHICVVTMDSPQQDFFVLDRHVLRLTVGGIGAAPTLGGRVLANVRRVRALRRALRVMDAPVVVSFILPMNVLTILAGLWLKSRIVVSERSDPNRQYLGWQWNVLRRILYRLADVVTANTHAALGAMRAYVPASKLRVLPNPLPRSGCTDRSSAAAPTILAVGRLHRVKAYDVLLDAFALIYEQVPGWRLVLVGDGPLRDSLKAQAEECGLTDRVDWVGRAADPFVYYRSAGIFVLASRYEGMPNTLLEAMSCGVATIVNDASPGPLEYVKHEVTGLVVPVEDTRALAGALRRLIADPALRLRLGKAARASVAQCGIDQVLPVWGSVLGLPDLTPDLRAVR